MSRRRVAVGVFMASCVAAFAVAPFPAMGAEVGTGKTSTNVDLVEVSLTNVPRLGTLRANLGVASSEATTQGTPAASVLLDAVRVGNQIVSAHKASSSEGESSKSVEIPIGVAGIGGHLTVADMSAEATADSATALLNALSGTIDVGPLGFDAQIGDNGIMSTVTPDAASSRAGASFGPIELRLGDLLPAEVMGALPLSALLDLVDQLGIALPVDVSDQVQVIRDLISVLEEVETKIRELDAARDDLDELVSDNAAVQAAQDAVDEAQAAVDAAQAQLAQAEAAYAAALSALETAQSDASAAQQQLTDATNQVSSMNAQMAQLQEHKATLESQLAACSIEVVCNDLRAQIAAIDTQIAATQAQLEGAQADAATAAAAVAATGTILAEAQAAHDAAQDAVDEAQAAVDAAQAELASAQSSLQQAIDQIIDPVVDQALALIEQIQSQIMDLLDTLEGALSNLPDLAALFEDLASLLSDAPLFKVGQIAVQVEATADETSGVANVICGASGIEVLGNSVGGESCDTLAGAFGEIRNAVMDVIESLPIADSLPAITINGLQSTTTGSDAPNAAGVTSATASLTGLHVGIGSVSLGNIADDIMAEVLAMLDETVASLPATDVPIDSTLQSVIDQVMAQIDALPIGDALNGIETIGMNATVAGLRTMSSYQARAPRQDTPREEPGGNGGPDDGTPPVAAPPAERAPLPFTGSSSSLVVALALWLMSAGMVLTFLAQRSQTAREVPSE